MNNTTTGFGVPPQDLHATLGGAFFGFTLGAMCVLSPTFGIQPVIDLYHRLFGITLRQAYQYYTTNLSDTVFRKSLVR